MLKTLLEEDTHDVYNTTCRFLLVPLFVIYAMYALFGLTSHSIDTDSNTTTHIARDSGLRMQLTVEQLPLLLHRGHSIAAVFLCVTLVCQKQTVVNMYSALCSKDGRYASHLFFHKWIGRLALGLVAVMDLCGLLMGPLSAWDGFTTFNFFFFAPWVFMAIGIYGCASSKLLCYHRFFGNMLLKGCVATPLARLAGAALQKQGWKDAQGYYVGIGMVTAVISAWQIADAAALWVSLSQGTKRKGKEKAA